jgi:hypothetical protein
MTTLIAINDTNASSGHGLLGALFIFGIYFIPSIIASVRQKAEGGGGIFFVNLLLGWTVVGWFIAFIWACTGRTRADIRREENQHRQLLEALALNKIQH